MSKRAKKFKHVGFEVTNQLANAIGEWLAANPESDLSKFFRIAAREKLERDNINIQDQNAAITT